MIRLRHGIETLLFSARWLLVPVYLGMILLLFMLVLYFLVETAHALPGLLEISEKNLIILTLSLIDLSLSANLVILVILSGYENFVSNAQLPEVPSRPGWLNKIDFNGLKLKILGSITIISAVHLLGDFLNAGGLADRQLGWEVVIVLAFALVGIIFALTDKISGGHDTRN